MIKIYLIILGLTIFFIRAQAQILENKNLKFEDKIYLTGVKTLETKRLDWEFSYPIVKLNSNEQLVISFDFLDKNLHDFYYTLIHCDKNWNVSNLIYSEFATGFEENTINDYFFSINTFADYVHYKILFPNNDVKPLISGNYLLVVYEENTENLVLSKKIYVAENKININAESKRSLVLSNGNAGQRIDFSIFKSTNEIIPENLQVTVQQNGRTDNLKTNLKPQFLSNEKIIFQDEIENTFEGGNEFRHLDIKTERFSALGIEDIYYEKPYYHCKKMIETARNYKKYEANQDLNGDFSIIKEGNDDSYQSADYFFVHFRLNSAFELPNSKIYLIGGFSNWQTIDENELFYNSDTQNYETSLFLKQGYYNYAYVVKNLKTGNLDFSYFEKSFSETENKYLILVYDTNPFNNFHQLIGYKIFSTVQF